jgi:hypothetical protein
VSTDDILDEVMDGWMNRERCEGGGRHVTCVMQEKKSAGDRSSGTGSLADSTISRIAETFWTNQER